MHARNFTTNVPKILDLKSSPEQIFSRKFSLGAPDSVRVFLRVQRLFQFEVYKLTPIVRADKYWLGRACEILVR